MFDLTAFKASFDSLVSFTNNKKEENITQIFNTVVHNHGVEKLNKDIKEKWLIDCVECMSNADTDEFRSIWARIIKGEHEKPGIVSTRALHAVKIMDKELASVFDKMCGRVLCTRRQSTGIDIRVPNFENVVYEGVNQRFIYALHEIGVINDIMSPALNFSSKDRFLFGGALCGIVHLDETPVDKFGIIGPYFTSIGREICTALGIIRRDDAFVRSVEAQLRRKNIKIIYENLNDGQKEEINNMVRTWHIS